MDDKETYEAFFEEMYDELSQHGELEELIVRHDPALAMGIVVEVESGNVLAVDAVHAYETWGFKDLSRELLDALNIWAEFLYAPLLGLGTEVVAIIKGVGTGSHE